jgi:hypothetical protein
MRSAIFSIVTGVILTLLLRGPAPPPPPWPPQPCVIHATALQSPAEAIIGDTFPAWLASQDISGAAVAFVSREVDVEGPAHHDTLWLPLRRPLSPKSVAIARSARWPDRRIVLR